MQYVNDDMDDMFRKAAESYPLDARGSDWDKVLAALQNETITAPIAKKKDKRRFLWLLMLLPMGLVCNYYYNEGRLFSGPATNQSKGPGPFENKLRTSEKPGLPGRSGQLSEKTDIPASPEEVSSNSATNNNPRNFSSRESAIGGASRKSTTAKKAPRSIGMSGAPNSDDITDAHYSGGMNSKGSADLNSRRMPTYTGYINPDKSNYGINFHNTAEFHPVSGEVKKTEITRNPKRFYIGLMGGLDKTTVEFQKKSRHGFDYGVLVGYQLNTKWGVEVGAFMDKKYYYTDAQYFKFQHLYLPPGVSITDIDGDCRMWDLSLGGTYSLGRTKKSGWFAAAGISSYLMKEENYEYTQYNAATGVSKKTGKTYTNGSKDFFSIANVSLGYTRQLGKIVDLRVEPYVKMPLQGVGAGQLPLLSGGIHIGVTGKLF
jgi:hypothetical protein